VAVYCLIFSKFTMGWWSYVFGVASPSGVADHPFQFDTVSLLPGVAATLSLILYTQRASYLSHFLLSLNVFSTRRQLHVETWNMFATQTSRAAKLIVFILFSLNLSSIGLAVVNYIGL